MVDLVRVTDPQTKAHITVTRQRAEALKLTPLKEAATDRSGRPLPSTPAVRAESPAPKTTAKAAEDK